MKNKRKFIGLLYLISTIFLSACLGGSVCTVNANTTPNTTVLINLPDGSQYSRRVDQNGQVTYTGNCQSGQRITPIAQ